MAFGDGDDEVMTLTMVMVFWYLANHIGGLVGAQCDDVTACIAADIIGDADGFQCYK